MTNEEADRLWDLVASKLAEVKVQDLYVRVFRDWVNFLGAETGTTLGAGLLARATREQALAYREKLLRAPGLKPRHPAFPGEVQSLAPATVRKKIMVIRAFHKFLIAGGALDRNIWDAVRAPRVSYMRRQPQMVPFEQVEKLLAAPSKMHGAASARAIRDAAILALLFGSGLRVGEVEALKIADYRRTENGLPFVYLETTKSGVSQNAAIPEWAAALLDAWAEVRGASTAGLGEPFFCSLTAQGGYLTGKRIADGTIRSWFRRYAASVGLEQGVFTPHSGRVTFVSHLLESGVPHRQVKDASRHKSIAMVDYYDRRRMEISGSAALLVDYRKKAGT